MIFEIFLALMLFVYYFNTYIQEMKQFIDSREDFFWHLIPFYGWGKEIKEKFEDLY